MEYQSDTPRTFRCDYVSLLLHNFANMAFLLVDFLSVIHSDVVIHYSRVFSLFLFSIFPWLVSLEMYKLHTAVLAFHIT